MNGFSESHHLLMISRINIWDTLDGSRSSKPRARDGYAYSVSKRITG